MTCDEATLALLLDPEEATADRARRHQRQCRACGLGPIPEDVDAHGSYHITGPALPEPSTIMVVTLWLIGAVQLALTAPWLISFDPIGLLGPEVNQAHQVRDGAFSVIIAVTALLAAWRPRWALPAFIISAVALTTQAAASLVDNTLVATGANESVHLLSIVATCLTGLLATKLTTLGLKRPQVLSAANGPTNNPRRPGPLGKLRTKPSPLTETEQNP